MKLNIGEIIRKYRRTKDWTQEQFAEKLGVSYQSVSRWENGSTYPDIEFLPTIALLFDISIDAVVTYNCNTLDRITAKVYSIQEDIEIRKLFKFYDGDHYLYSQEHDIPFLALVNSSGWEWFDPIRNEERYQNCVLRMKKLSYPSIYIN